PGAAVAARVPAAGLVDLRCAGVRPGLRLRGLLRAAEPGPDGSPVSAAFPGPAVMMWTPVAPCGPRCLVEPPAHRAGWLRRFGRCAGLLGVLTAGTTLRLVPGRWRGRAVRGCARAVLWVLGVRLRVTGKLPGRRALVVANHIS